MMAFGVIAAWDGRPVIDAGPVGVVPDVDIADGTPARDMDEYGF